MIEVLLVLAFLFAIATIVRGLLDALSGTSSPMLIVLATVTIALGLTATILALSTLGAP